jgi:hypothetical protein
MLAEAGQFKIYPLEEPMTVAKFHENGGTPLKAIKRYYRDFSGGPRSEVRNCRDVDCSLHPFRLGNNPNRRMSAEQRMIAAAHLKKARAKRRRTGRPPP